MTNDRCRVPGCDIRHDGRGHPNPRERFWTYVDVQPDGCWLWTGAVERNGYARFRHDGKRTGVHRYAYEVLVGPIPSGMTIDHLCRERLCVNPDHLEVVTGRENTRRREDLRGETHGCARLTEDDVRAIKRALNDHGPARGRGGIGGVLARRYGVSKVTISAIKTGRIWAHVEAEETS